MSSTPPTFAEHEFRKARASQPDKECVQVARRDGWVEVRDDKTAFGAPDDHRLVFTAEQFDAFLAAVRAGDTDGRCLEMIQRPDGSYLLRDAGSPTATGLEFTAAEVAAFVEGVRDGEFESLAYTA